jgi:tubulin-specific chaperone D
LSKILVRFFPHEIADLSIALDFMKLPDGLAQHRYLWSMRYVMLLWLYIICIIPFDLSQFDDPNDIGGTANSLEKIAKGYLSSAGLEREAAALLLSRLYMRYVRSNLSYLGLICLGRIQAQAFMNS